MTGGERRLGERLWRCFDLSHEREIVSRTERLLESEMKHSLDQWTLGMHPCLSQSWRSTLARTLLHTNFDHPEGACPSGNFHITPREIEHVYKRAPNLDQPHTHPGFPLVMFGRFAEGQYFLMCLNRHMTIGGENTAVVCDSIERLARWPWLRASQRHLLKVFE